MNTKVTEIIVAILLGITIPSLLILLLQDRVLPDKTINSTEPTKSTATTESFLPPAQIPVLFESGTVINMPIEEYVLCVVLREMPASFEPEALKAQAIVARTYAIRRAVKNGKHSEAAVCTASSCCQGYCSPVEYRNAGGKQKDIDKIQEAVEATAGLVIVYEGELIDATYFSCSGGYTEDAQAVWGTDIPYLRSVESPGEERASRFVDTVTFSVEDFTKKLGLSDKKKITVERISYTEGNGIESISICGQTFTGKQLRQKLKLRSTAFVINAVGDTVTITTKGYGHRVGMSQYGADAMAVTGASCDEILKHYYQGVSLIPFEFD